MSWKPTKLGENLRLARESAGLTQREAAEALDMWATHISRLECSQHLPSLATLGRLCVLYNTDPIVILDGVSAEDLVALAPSRATGVRR